MLYTGVRPNAYPHIKNPQPGTNCELFDIYVSADIYLTWLGTQYGLENIPTSSPPS